MAESCWLNYEKSPIIDVWQSHKYFFDFVENKRDLNANEHYTKKIKFSIKDFPSKCDQILRKLRVSSSVQFGYFHIKFPIFPKQTNFLLPTTKSVNIYYMWNGSHFHTDLMRILQYKRFIEQETLDKKQSFQLKICSVNVAKSSVNCEFGQIC